MTPLSDREIQRIVRALNAPDVVRLFEAFFARGGSIVIVPPGLRGSTREFYDWAIAHGRAGSLIRYGMRAVPAEAQPFVVRGVLSLSAARMPTVWRAVSDAGEADRATLAELIRLPPTLLTAPLGLLLRRGALVSRSCDRRLRYAVSGPLPDWRDYIEAGRAA